MIDNDKAAAATKRKHAIMIALLIIVFILFIAPFILVLINVFKDQADITTNPLALVGDHGFTLKNFPEAMRKMDFWNVFKNSLIITTLATVLTILVSAMASFVIVRNGKWKACSILFALMINEVRLGRSKKVLQSIYTFPNFLSWVIVASIMINVLGQKGLVNGFLTTFFGTRPIAFLGKPEYFRPVIFITDVWKTAGWSAIIYMASISGIDMEQYEAAEIDGASRLQRIWYITLPGIKTTIMVLFILAVGNLMSGGFDQIFNLSNSATMKVAETLDMYIYRITFKGSVDFGFSSAVALFRSVINMLLLIVADRVSKAVGGSGLLG